MRNLFIILFLLITGNCLAQENTLTKDFLKSHIWLEDGIVKYTFTDSHVTILLLPWGTDTYLLTYDYYLSDSNDLKTAISDNSSSGSVLHLVHGDGHLIKYVVERKEDSFVTEARWESYPDGAQMTTRHTFVPFTYSSDEEAYQAVLKLAEERKRNLPPGTKLIH